MVSNQMLSGAYHSALPEIQNDSQPLIRPLQDYEIEQVDGAFLDEFTITFSTTAGGLIGQSVGSRIGASIGFAAGGPVGALIGAGIGFTAGYIAVEHL